MLSSDNYREFLIEKEPVKISKIEFRASKDELLRRKFLNPKGDSRNFMQIKHIAENSGIFLYTEYYSQVRASVFESFVVRLKEMDKRFWVQFVKIVAFSNMISSFSDCHQLISAFIGAITDIEKKIFEKMYKMGRLIILIDGIDELEQSVYDNLIKLLLAFRKETKNQLWISFNPQRSELLEKTFKAPSFKSVIVTNGTTKRRFIESFLFMLGYKSMAERMSMATEILGIIDRMEAELENICTLEDRGLVEIVTELYLKTRIEANFKGIFGVFEKIIDRQLRNREFDNEAS